jgi:hypothetical protein
VNYQKISLFNDAFDEHIEEDMPGEESSTPS